MVTLRLGLECEVRKVGTKEWRPYRTTKFMTFAAADYTFDGDVTHFRKGGWELRVPSDCVGGLELLHAAFVRWRNDQAAAASPAPTPRPVRPRFDGREVQKSLFQNSATAVKARPKGGKKARRVGRGRPTVDGVCLNCGEAGEFYADGTRVCGFCGGTLDYPKGDE